MNPRAYRLQLGIILLGILAWIPVASAQSPVIADADKIAGTVARSDIQKYIQFYIDALKGEDPEARTQAREALVSGATVKTTGQVPSAAYLDQYSELLNTACKPLAIDPNWVTRMNVAIVASKVAEKADNTRLLDVTLTLLGDKTEGVQLWALRAAHAVLPAELRTPGAAKNDKLIPAILAVAQQRKSGSIAAEAYTALALDYNRVTERSKNIPANVKVEMYAAVVPQVLAVMRNRTAEYIAGTISDPTADRIAANFLVSTSVWPHLDAKTQSAALQVLLDLLVASGQSAAKLGGPGKYDDVLQTMRDTARALTAWATANKVAGSEALIRGLAEVYSPQNMKPWDQLPQVVQEMTKLDKSLKAPGAAPATAPAGK